MRMTLIHPIYICRKAAGLPVIRPEFCFHLDPSLRLRETMSDPASDWSEASSTSSVQHLDQLGSSGGHEGQFSRDPLPVLFAGGHREHFWHVHPAFLRPSTMSPTFQGALKYGFGEAAKLSGHDGTWPASSIMQSKRRQLLPTFNRRNFCDTMNYVYGRPRWST